jgi:integrase
VATLYKPKIFSYRLPDGSYRTPEGERVTKNTPGRVLVVSQSKKWYGRYTDGAGRPCRVPLSESKEIARRMLAKLAGDAQLAGVGIADPFAEHRARQLAEHAEDFRRYLAAKGNTPEHVAKTVSRVLAVLAGCQFAALDDLQATDVMDFIAGLRNRECPSIDLDQRKEWYTKTELTALLGIHPAGLARSLRRAGLAGSGKGKARRYGKQIVKALEKELRRGAGVATCNHYLTAIKGFTRWLAKDRRIAVDPLAHLSRMNPDADVRHPRRALPEETFVRFVDATGEGKPFRGLTGADRLVLYTLAANTGFRAGELASLLPRSFALKADNPTVTVAAAYSKHRREDVQPLRPDVADMMRQYIAGKPDAALWPGTWKDVAAEMVRFDLAAAGIPYKDESGRFFDFHAMRGQFISFLAAGGVHPKVAQVLARHSTITLTMDFYTHLDVLDVTGALDKLPEAPGARKQPQDRPAGKKRRSGQGENPAATGKARTRRFGVVT